MKSEQRIRVAPELWAFPLLGPLPAAGLMTALFLPVALLFNDTGVPIERLIVQVPISCFSAVYTFGIVPSAIAGLALIAATNFRARRPIGIFIASIVSYGVTAAIFWIGPRYGIGTNLYDPQLAPLAALPIAAGALLAGVLTSLLRRSGKATAS